MSWRRRSLLVGTAALAALAMGPVAAEPAAAAVGAVTEFSLAAGANPGAVTRGPDGALWFVEAGRIGRITTNGALTEFPMPAGRTPGSIAAGPDGDLWFTDSQRIGKMTTAGVVTEYLLPGNSPSGYSQPVVNLAQQITAGPDGNVWFTQTVFSRVCVCTQGGAIDRSTTAGAITQLPVPSGGTRRTAAQPRPITSGPDGALWYGDSNRGLAGRMTTAGALTTYQVPLGAPASIAAGPDGALWLTASSFSGSRIYRLSVSGAFTAFAVTADGTNGASVGAVALGPDGNLWFTDYDMTTSRGSIFRITTSGALTRFPFPTMTEIDGLTGGPDAAVWFTGVDRADPNNSRPFVGRLPTA